MSNSAEKNLVKNAIFSNLNNLIASELKAYRVEESLALRFANDLCTKNKIDWETNCNDRTYRRIIITKGIFRVSVTIMNSYVLSTVYLNSMEWECITSAVSNKIKKHKAALICKAYKNNGDKLSYKDMEVIGIK
jgi:hypothetical protein